MDPSTVGLLEGLFEAAEQHDRDKARPIIEELARRIDSFDRATEEAGRAALAARREDRL